MAIEIVDFPMKNGGSFHCFLYDHQRVSIIWVCLKIAYPIVPNGFADHYPYEKWLAIIVNINPTFSVTNPYQSYLICSPIARRQRRFLSAHVKPAPCALGTSTPPVERWSDTGRSPVFHMVFPSKNHLEKHESQWEG